MAADYITGVMEAAGYECGRQRFKTPAGIQAPNAVILLLGFFSSLLLSRRGRWQRGLGLSLAGLMAACILGENTTLVQPAHYLVPLRTGRNVLARPPGSTHPALVVVAHFDTVNEGTAFNERWVRFVPAGFKAYVAFPALAVLLSRPGWKWPGRMFRLAMFAGAAQMVQWALLGGHNPGANDDASGVAVALEAAERNGGTDGGRAWFLFTDGEEAGITGMRAFIAEHGDLLATADILNLESQGAGELCYLAREGMLVRFKASPELTRRIEYYARSSSASPGRRDVSSFTTDALAALARGLSAVTLVRLDANGLIRGWHHHDYLERIDPVALSESADFVSGLVAFLCDTPNRK